MADEQRLAAPHLTAPAARERLRGWWGKVTGFSDWDTAAVWAQSPLRWGPVLWQALHDLSAFVDSRQRARCFRALLRTLPAALPCAKCRRHVTQHLHALRDTLAAVHDRTGAVNAVIALHNKASLAIKGTERARLYERVEAAGELQDALALVRNHGRSSKSGMPEEQEQEDCGCAERKAMALGRLTAGP